MQASTAGRADHSGILVWMFLGFCVLIVMAQLLPALMAIPAGVKSTNSARGKQHVTADAKK